MVRMVSVKKYCKRYSDVVPIEHTFKKHMLMVCPYADYDHKINPIGYKFPESGLKNISYYRNCADVDHYDPLFGDIDFMDEIMYLDYKLIDKALDNSNTMNFLLAFINNKQPLKVLHLVNFWHALIPSKSWNHFCDFINDTSINDGTYLEIHNKNPQESIEFCLNEILKLNLNKFIGVDYSHLNDEPKYVPLKNNVNENIGIIFDSTSNPYGHGDVINENRRSK